MRAKEIIDNMKASFANAGRSSSILGLSDLQLMYMLDEARAKLSSQKMDAAVNIDPMAQHVDAELENTDEFEESFVDLNVSTVTIPKPIAYLNGTGIFTVGPLDGSTSYSHISYSEIRTALARKYTGSAPKWFWFNDKVYILNLYEVGLAHVRVRGIFDEPWRVVKANGLLKRLSPFDFEYPLTMKDADSVYKIAMASDMAWADDSIQALQTQQAKASKDNQLLAALKGLGANQQQSE